MKPSTIDQSVIRTFNVHHLSWMGLIILVVVVGLLLSLVAPARAAGTAPVDSPNASYGCTGVYHRVRTGETIYSIAARYGSTAYRIASCNGRSYTVYVGQSLLVPVYRRGTSGWIEGIDFARDVNSPVPAILEGAGAP